MGLIPPTSSKHRLRRGLPGYLILFATHAFAPQRQSKPRRLPSPLVFLLISTDFTPTPGILPSSARFKPAGFECNSGVKLRASHPTLQAACVRFTPNNSEQRLHPP